MFIRKAICSHHNKKDIYCLRNSWFHLSGSDGLPWQSTSDNNHGNNCTLAAGQQKCTIQEKCYSDLSASVPVLYLSFMRNALIKECFLKSYLHEDLHEMRRDVSFTRGGGRIVAKVLGFILNYICWTSEFTLIALETSRPVYFTQMAFH